MRWKEFRPSYVGTVHDDVRERFIWRGWNKPTFCIVGKRGIGSGCGESGHAKCIEGLSVGIFFGPFQSRK